MPQVRPRVRRLIFGPGPGLLVIKLGVGLASLVLVAAAVVYAIRPRSPSDPLAPGHLAYARGDYEAASRLARDRLKAAEGDRPAMQLLARSAARLARDASAVSLYDRLFPDFMAAEDLYLLGLSLRRMGKPGGAPEMWRRALEVDPDYPEILAVMVPVRLAHDQFREAAGIVERLAKSPAWSTRADELLGEVRYAEADMLGAVAAWERSLNRPRPDPDPASRPEVGGAPAPAKVRKDLARALLRASDPARAITALGPVLASGPDAEASWLLSRAHLQGGAMPEALAALKASGSFSEDEPTLADPAGFVGAARCVECHREKFQAQRGSRHARTFARSSQLEDLAPPASAVPDPFDGKVHHAFHRAGKSLEMETRTTDQVYRAVVQYAFGSGDRGKTLVGRDDAGRDRELRLSLYHELGEKKGEATRGGLIWDLTTGHRRVPARPADYLGVELDADSFRRCFACHVTNPRSVLDPEAPGPEGADPAIGCEKCHGPGGNHLMAVAAKFPDLAIARPSLASGARIVRICGQCHSPHGEPVRPEDPMAVRFQSTTLTWSRCYTESNDRFDCVTCHDPHRDASTSASFYEARCLSCHAMAGSEAGARMTKGALHRARPAEPTHSPSCPINPRSGCISCHMPTVRTAAPHSAFTDHFIRVHREGSESRGK